MREIRLSRSEGGGVIHLALPTPSYHRPCRAPPLPCNWCRPENKALRHRAGRFRGHSLVQNPRSEKLDCGYHFGCRCRGGRKVDDQAYQKSIRAPNWKERPPVPVLFGWTVMGAWPNRGLEMSPPCCVPCNGTIRKFWW